MICEMRNNWLFQGIVSNAMYGLLAFSGGVVVTFLQHNSSKWGRPLLDGLLAFLAISGGTLCLKAIGRLNSNRAVINPDTIEAAARRWLDDFKYSVQNSP